MGALFRFLRKFIGVFFINGCRCNHLEQVNLLGAFDLLNKVKGSGLGGSLGLGAVSGRGDSGGIVLVE